MSINPSEYALMGAGQLVEAYRNRELSPVDSAQAALALIDQLNPALRAFYVVNSDQALRSARSSERRWHMGEPIGALDGVPTSVKDAVWMVGQPVHRGSAAFDASNFKCVEDAPHVARLKESGAIILGKTTMPDFGILGSGTSTQHGTARNPWSLRHNPGGSSSGVSAAIAAGIHPLGVGTDIVGSIRLPASFCGLVGLKPTRGRVPYYFPNSPALVAGPLARTVADAALLMNVITRPDPRDFTSLPPDGTDYVKALKRQSSPKRFGLVEHIGFGPPVDSEVKRVLRKVAGSLGELGHEVCPVESALDDRDLRAAEDFYRARVHADLQGCPAERRHLCKMLDQWAAQTRDFSAALLYGTYQAMIQTASKVAVMFGDRDFLVLPTSPVTPYLAEADAAPGRHFFESWVNTFAFNLTDHPVISLNAGNTEDGLPIGIQIVGRRFDDKGLLAFSASVEEVLSGSRKWPSPDDICRSAAGIPNSRG